MSESASGAVGCGGGLDVIVRLHVASRAFELRRAIFSLVCQNYRPLAIRLVTQRFSPADIAEVTRCVAPALKIDPTVDFGILNYSLSEPADARSALINMGLRYLQGRYLAFLDYDDVIYPKAYSRLIGELHNSNCAIAFGKILIKDLDVFADALICDRQREVFHGNDVIDLFINNFCPIHSYVIDRQRMNGGVLWFDERLDRSEDYDFLIRFCAANPASFALKDVAVGAYHFKNDSSNTIMVEYETREARAAGWMRSEEFIESRRGECVVSREVQQSLGLPVFDPSLTVRRLIDNAVEGRGSQRLEQTKV